MGGIAGIRGLPIPIRRRANWFELNSPIIDFNPLCPPALPEGRRRMFPKGRDKSSQMTKMSSKAVPCLETSLFKLRPELFIKVMGINKEHSKFPISAFANSPWLAAEFRQGTLSCLEKASTTKKPRL